MRIIKNPTHQYILTFFKYITAPRNQLEQLFANKSTIKNTSLFPSLKSEIINLPFIDNQSYPNFVNHIRSVQWQTFIKLHSAFANYQGYEIKEIKQIFSNFINDNLIIISKKEFKYAENNNATAMLKAQKKEKIVIEVIYSVFDNKVNINKKYRCWIVEENFKQEIIQVIKLKKTELDYLVGLVKLADEKFYFVKFNDFATKNFNDGNDLFFNFAIEINEAWLTRINQIDFNESFNESNVFDFAIHTENENFFWYGRLNLVKSQNEKKANWSKHGYIKLNKYKKKEDVQNYSLNNVSGLVVSSLNKTTDNKKFFYGNIVVSTIAGSSSSQIKTHPAENPPSSKGIKNNKNHLKYIWRFSLDRARDEIDLLKDDLLDQDLLGEKTKEKLGNALLISLSNALSVFKSHFNNRNNFNFEWKTKSFSIQIYQKYKLGQPDGHPENWREIPINLSDELLKDVVMGKAYGKLKYVLKRNYKHAVPYQADSFYKVNLLVYLDDNEILNEYLYTGNDFSGSDSSDIFLSWAQGGYSVLAFDIGCSYEFDLSYQENLVQNNHNQIFKIVVRDYDPELDNTNDTKNPNNPNNLIFERDKIINNIQASKPGLAIGSLGVYFLVQINERWYLYFFSNLYDASTSGTLVKSQAEYITEIDKYFRAGLRVDYNDIFLIKFQENQHDNPIIAVVTQTHVMFPYKNQAHNNYNSNNKYLVDKIEFDYGNSLKYLPLLKKEQNICKIAFMYRNVDWFNYQFGDMGILNVLFDGKDFSLHNYPFLFKTDPNFNTLSENFKITNFQNEKLILGTNLNNIFSDENNLVLSTIIDHNSLNTVPDLSKYQNWSWKDNNNNTVFNVQQKVYKGIYEDLTFNTNVQFKWFENKKEIAFMQNAFVKLFTDLSYIKYFRITDIKHKVNDNGSIYELNIKLDVNRITIDGNKLIIPLLFIPERDMGAKYLMYDFQIGEAETDTWRPLDLEPIDLTTQNAVSTAITYELIQGLPDFTQNTKDINNGN